MTVEEAERRRKLLEMDLLHAEKDVTRLQEELQVAKDASKRALEEKQV
jgi:hypothetical protein